MRAEGIERDAMQIVRREILTLMAGELSGLSQKKFVERLMSVSGLPKRALSKATRIVLAMALQKKCGTDKLPIYAGGSPNEV
jgi:hypothetical protein